MMACEYCNDEQNIWEGEYSSGFITYYKKLLITEYENCNSETFDIHFCPMCGERLGDE